MTGETGAEGHYHIAEKSITSCKYPTQWKTARVRCAHKKGSTLECGNYRPVPLLSIPGKLLESIVYKQIDNHPNDNNLISNGQWGFRKGRSAEQLMLSMTEKWKQAFDNGKVVGVIFVDFQKAFDSICRKKLSMKLHGSGISANLHEWIMNYLQDRKQYITINGEASENKQIEYGVPQGLLLRPRLYGVHANDLPNSSAYASIEMFADDSTAYYIGNSVDEVTPVLQDNK